MKTQTFLCFPSLKSKKFYWHFSGWRQAVHHLPRTKTFILGLFETSVREHGIEIEKKWNRVYGRTPTHIFSSGLYVQSEYHYSRAIQLGYNPNGKLAVGYLD